METKVYSTGYPENPPEWYWTRGLHVACIKAVESFEFLFDYNNYNRNLLKLIIDSKGAIYDTSVKEIRFYNYKILTSDFSLDNRKTIWWLSDRLIENGDNYILEIDLQDLDSYPEEFTFKIKFEQVEVIRE